jgi:hypothetical protein
MMQGARFLQFFLHNSISTHLKSVISTRTIVFWTH